MELSIKAFGIAKDIVGGSSVTLEIGNGTDTNALRNTLEEKYPRLKQIRSYLLAINNEYAQPSQVLAATDEIAIIPPVSGG